MYEFYVNLLPSIINKKTGNLHSFFQCCQKVYTGSEMSINFSIPGGNFSCLGVKLTLVLLVSRIINYTKKIAEVARPQRFFLRGVFYSPLRFHSFKLHHGPEGIPDDFNPEISSHSPGVGFYNGKTKS